jgi:hypothetical protein
VLRKYSIPGSGFDSPSRGHESMAMRCALSQASQNVGSVLFGRYQADGPFLYKLCPNYCTNESVELWPNEKGFVLLDTENR